MTELERTWTLRVDHTCKLPDCCVIRASTSQVIDLKGKVVLTEDSPNLLTMKCGRSEVGVWRRA